MKSSLLVGLCLSLFIGQASANSELAPIIINAGRVTTTIDTAPVNITTINAEQIADSSATNLSQLLELQAGIYIKDLYGITGSRSSADIGGFGATGTHNTLILINGRRQNDVDLSGANLATIPLESIARIEIIHGSSAVLYGDNAVSGVINIVTKSGFEQDSASATITAGSFNTNGVNVDYSKNYGDTSVYTAADIRQSDGYRDESQFDQKSLVVEISRNISDRNYGLRLNRFVEDMELPGDLNEADFKNDPTLAGSTSETAEQQRNTVDLFISGNQFAAELAYSDKHQESMIFGPAKADLNTLSFTPRFKKTISSHRLITGIDYYNSKLDSNADFGAPNINKSNTTRESYALYVSDTVTTTPKSSINFGLRRQWVALDISNTNASSGKSSDRQNDAVNAWDVGLNHQFNDNIQAHARIAESFRLAVLDEMWNYYDGQISPLKPQTGRHVEAGADIKLSTKANVSLNLFHITLDDEIGYINNSNKNLAPTKHEGADINYNNQLNSMWQIGFGYAWRDVTFRSGIYKDNQIPESPSHKATLTNAFTIDDHNLVNTDLVYIGKQYFGNDFANDGKQMPGYTRINLSYQHKHNNWKTSVRVVNVTNKIAADSGYYATWLTPPYTYYPLPGRAYYLTIGAKF